MLTKITRQHQTDRQRLRCVPGVHEFVLQLLKFSFEPLMGLHQVTRYLWHTTTSDTSTSATLKHHYHHHHEILHLLKLSFEPPSGYEISVTHTTSDTSTSTTLKHHHLHEALHLLKLSSEPPSGYEMSVTHITTPPHQHQQHFQASPSFYELKDQQNICTGQVSYRNKNVGATSMVWVLTKRHIHKGKEDVHFEWCWSCMSWRKESCINVLISTYM